MNRSTGPAAGPSPPRPSGVAASLLALAAAPFGWSLQLMADYGLSSGLCPPGSMVVTDDGLGRGGEFALLVAVNLACLAITVAAGVLSLRGWRAVQDAGPLDEAGRRARFLSACGLLASGVFTIATLFNTLEPFVVPSCWSLKP